MPGGRAMSPAPIERSPMQRSASYGDFWPRYLGEHRGAATRALHYGGTALALFLLAGAVASGAWWLAAVGLASGYALAWTGHAFVERNRPVTFTHPWWSFASDFRMFFTWLGGRPPASRN